MTHFRKVLLDYSIQKGFRPKRIRNEKKMITCGCKGAGYPWRVNGNTTQDRVTYMLKTLRNEHTCLAITKNGDANSFCLGKKFQDLIKESPQISIRVLNAVVLRTCRLDVNDHTLYRAKRYVMKIGSQDHKVSYNKLY
ncbi:hypothetical protein ACOSQ4_004878 [Xanthoceras sorbifolium]